MKTKRILSLLLCAAAVGVIVYLGSISSSLPTTGSLEEMGNALGIFSLMPTMLAVFLSFLTGNVVLALLIGIVAGELMLCVMNGAGFIESASHILPNTINEILEVISDSSSAQVLLLCALVGGLVGVLIKSGGFMALAKSISRKINTPKRANLAGQLFCTLFFFDDYANALISGPVLQPVTDKAKVSRERLSYIVDSTAAPVAGIAVVSSWVAVEMSVIEEGLKVASIQSSSFEIFVSSIPYCFYCIFALAFILMTTLMGREYGPMLEAERRSRTGVTLKEGSVVAVNTSEEVPLPEKKEKLGILVSFGSIAVLVIYAVVSFINGKGDTIELLLQAALFCSLLATIAGTAFGLFKIDEGINAWLSGASNLMPTITVLLLAWSLASIVEKLGTVYFVVELISSGITWSLVPVIIFVSCCFISFAAGSYGCMFMVMPMAIPIAFAVMSGSSVELNQNFLLLCISAVLTGGIFGDHCSPMTDCTILAALGSGCEVMDHVVTQMPYALTVAAISLICIFVTTIGVPVWVSIIAGLAIMALIIRTVGKKV